MSILIPRKKEFRQRKPDNPEIDWGHWRSNGLEFFSTVDGDAVAGSEPSTVGTPETVDSADGYVRKYNADNEYDGYSLSDAGVISPLGLTVAGRLITTGATSARVASKATGDAVNNPFRISWQTNLPHSAEDGFYFIRAGANKYQAWESPAGLPFSQSTDEFYAITSADDATGTAPTIYVGTSSATATASYSNGASQAVTGSNAQLRLGNWNTGGDIRLGWFGLWSLEQGAEELLEISESPFEGLKKRRKYWVLPTAAQLEAFIASMTSASLGTTAQSTTVEVASKSDLTSGIFNSTALNIDQRSAQLSELSAQSFGVNALQLEALADYLVEQGVSAFNFTALDINQKIQVLSELSSQAFGFSALELEAQTDYLVEYTAAVFGLSPQSIDVTAASASSTEALLATSVVSKVGVLGTDPENIAALAADDVSYVVAAANNVDIDLRLGFDTPTGALTPAATQTITVIARQFDEGQTGIPTITLEVWETGGATAIASTVAANVNAGDNTYTITFTDADTVDDTGANLELRIIGTAIGGAPGVRNAVNVDFVKWDVEYVIVSQDFIATLDAVLFASVAENMGILTGHLTELSSAALTTTSQTISYSTSASLDLTDANFGLLAIPLDVDAKANLDLSAASLASAPNLINTSANTTFDLLSASIVLSGLDVDVASESKVDLSSGSLSLTAQALSAITNYNVDLLGSLFGFNAQDLSYITGNGLELTTALFNSSALDLNIKTNYDGALSASTFAQVAKDISTATDLTFDLTAAIVAFDAKDIETTTEGSLDLSVVNFQSVANDLATNFEFSVRINTAEFNLLANPIEAISGKIISLLTAEFGMTPQAASYSADSIIEFIIGNFSTEANPITLVPAIIYVYGRLITKLESASVATLEGDLIAVLDENIGAELD